MKIMMPCLNKFLKINYNLTEAFCTALEKLIPEKQLTPFLTSKG